jgi:hypothetical protein
MYSNFNTKAYTLSRLIEEVSSIRPNVSETALIQTLSPRFGASSVKFQALDTWLEGKLDRVLAGTTAMSLGKSARTRLLNALKCRKQYGGFFCGNF